MVLPMHEKAGAAAKRRQLCAKMSATLAYCEGSIFAGTPGAYDFSQGISMVRLSSTIVAIASSAGASWKECNLPRRAPCAPILAAPHEETGHGNESIPQATRRRHERQRRAGDARLGPEDLARGPGRLRARQVRGPAHVRHTGRAGQGAASARIRGRRPGAQD